MGKRKIADLNALYDAFKASLKGSAWKEEPQRFEMEFLSEIVALKQEIESREYKTSKGTEFTLSERGKTRYIHGSRMRDRVVRHALCDEELTPALGPYLIHNNGASQKGKGITFARKMFERDLHNYWLEHHSNDGYVGFIDLSKFYDNIQHRRVKDLINPLITEEAQWILNEVLRSFEIDVSYMTDEEYANCLEQKFNSIEYHESITPEMMTGEKMMPKSVDIGDQVSQDIGVFFPTRLDNYAKIVRGVKRYGRYMDDIYIILETKEELLSVINGIASIAKDMGMFINLKKTHIAKLYDRYKYLQVKYSLDSKGKVIKRINPRAVTRCRRRLKAYGRLDKKDMMAYEDIEQSYKSWMGDYAKLMSKKQIKGTKSLFKELFGKEPRWKK